MQNSKILINDSKGEGHRMAMLKMLSNTAPAISVLLQRVERVFGRVPQVISRLTSAL